MVEGFWQLITIAAAGLEAGVGTAFRYSRWGYASVNAAHVLGIALLVGSILPLDLKLLGFWRDVPRQHLARVLIPTAAAGFLLALTSGALLFSVRATEYITISIFYLKMAFVAIGFGSALLIHLKYGLWLENASRRRLASGAIISMACWLGALAAGRMIAFSGE
ncbi:MAG: DUF2214 domain-containing protein [Methyloligellaceae bacterium]